jgi:thiol-disulfide isomerase/thioredoxin
MRPIARTLVLSASLLLALSPALADDAAIKLQGKGARRETLDALQHKPFDGSLCSQLDGWTGGPALTKDSFSSGRPALIVAWASWYKTSHAALADAQKMADKNKDLLVLGVHHSKGFDKAPGVLSSNSISFPIAHDASGKFFQGLNIPAAGPNFYLVDRAGNLRFADIEKTSLEDAVKIVVDESPSDAAKSLERAAEAQKAAGQTPLGGPQVKVRANPDDYKGVKWPTTNKSPLSAKNLQGKPLPVKLGKEKWLGKEPDREGKILVLDFWATWCPPCRAAMPLLDELSKKHGKDVVVIGISDEDEATVKKFIKAAKHSYPQAVDPEAGVKNALGIEGIPHVVVLSTDGVIRWQGNPHPSADLQGLQETVAKLIDLDPGVKARQDREKKPG